jgi:serine/threonine protein kinase
VLRSGVLQREELQDALRSLPVDLRNDSDAVAEHLVEAGKLSRFQAEKLLQGMAVGLVLGPFHVLAPIGKGGMGTVYLARDSRGDTLVALKVLPPKRAREEERLLARFRREMEMCSRVAHPHLAWTYEVGVSQGCYYIALEYIPGKTLFRLINEEGPLATPRAARLFAEVASALDHAHNQGLIHRDLKPSNIIITPHDHAKVLDLGLALVEGEAPTDREVQGGPGYVVGTMDYIAPEQTEDPGKVDARSDIYSLGCTLYFCLTGRAPFTGGTAQEKIQRHRHEEPPPIPQFNPSVPPAFIGLVRKMMTKNPDHRLRSAAELQARLEEWAEPKAPLPLDQRGDPEYREAVAALEHAEAPPELVDEVIPVGIPVSYKRAGQKPAPPATEEAISTATAPMAESWHKPWLWAILAAVAALAAVLGALAIRRFLH